MEINLRKETESHLFAVFALCRRRRRRLWRSPEMEGLALGQLGFRWEGEKPMPTKYGFWSGLNRVNGADIKYFCSVHKKYGHFSGGHTYNLPKLILKYFFLV